MSQSSFLESIQEGRLFIYIWLASGLSELFSFSKFEEEYI